MGAKMLFLSDPIASKRMDNGNLLAGDHLWADFSGPETQTISSGRFLRRGGRRELASLMDADQNPADSLG